MYLIVKKYIYIHIYVFNNKKKIYIYIYIYLIIIIIRENNQTICKHKSTITTRENFL